MKKLFEKPEIEIVSLNSVCDVIATSPYDEGDMVPNPGDKNYSTEITNL